jgi:hypothetical protein
MENVIKKWIKNNWKPNWPFFILSGGKFEFDEGFWIDLKFDLATLEEKILENFVKILS